MTHKNTQLALLLHWAKTRSTSPVQVLNRYTKPKLVFEFEGERTEVKLHPPHITNWRRSAGVLHDSYPTVFPKVK